MMGKRTMASIGGAVLLGMSATAGLGAMAAPPPPAQQRSGPINGATIFAQNCAACHQANGKGIPGAFPALDGDAFVKGPPSVVAKTVLKGRGGMPSFSSDLTDQQIAAVLTHVRSSWSNHAPPVTTDVVAAARKGAAAEQPSVLPGH